MLNRPSTAVNKWAVVGVGTVLALVAILVISSSAPNGIFAHPHEPPVDTHTDAPHIHYAENDTGPVRDFDSTDPEGSVIEWNVRGVDAADFEISSAGVLTFMESPDYENQTDRGLNLNLGTNGDQDFDDAGKFAPNDNNYQITVSATEMSAALPAKRTDMDLTVVVDNVDDPGELTLQWLQPEVGTEIDATLTDPDGEITGTPVWKWYTSKVSGPDVGDFSHWNVVTGQTDESYFPVAADDGKYLWVHVAYTDPEDSAKTADAKSMNPVRAKVSPNANASPDFEDDTDTRTVPESTAVGDPVGLPVTATDTDNDTLTYELDDDAFPDNAFATESDLQFFDIDMETGQIEVAQELDYDAVGERRANGAVAGTYTVIVRATDPSSLADNITVTITAENVNEDPIVTGRAELSVPEGTDDGYTILPDAPGITERAGPTNQKNEYVYEDPDHLDSIARWHLEGDDAGAFDHSGRFEPRYLQFKTAPDYENPTDMNRDNVYEVTLVATDTDPLGTGAGIGKVNVWLTVTNVPETGKVVFTEGETAFLDEMLVAEVQDPDDHGGDLGEPYQGVHIVNWQWSRSTNNTGTPPFEDIVGATTNRYTAQDMDRGYYLRATANYTDPLSGPDDPATEEDERVAVSDPPIATDSLRTAMATTENAVKVAPGPESAPTFDETGTVTRYVAENTAPGGDVGASVTAMAANTNETLSYTLEGTDAKYFDIGNDMDDKGQITVGGAEGKSSTDPGFDYDDPAKKKRFSVTVKVEVTGGDANQNAQVDVVIIVTDVDESPVVTDGDVAEIPMTVPTYPEIKDGAPNTAAVATYVGTDPEGGTISWDLRGADAALFTIDGGVLKFMEAPNFENPRDVDGTNTATDTAMAGNNEYNIVIRAIASRARGDTGPAETVDTTVAVTVTDVDEDGEVVISLLQPEAKTVIMASLTDPDGSPSGNLPVTDTEIDSATWVWTVSKVVQGSLNVDNDDHWGTAPGDGHDTNSYIPVDSDATGSKYLRVTASYTGREGATKMAHAMSANPVQAEGLGSKNQSPDFVGAKVERSVAETAEVGDDVPGAVVATVVAPSDTDILTYGLRAVTEIEADGVIGVAAPDDAVADVAAFDIDKATGQITVAQELDFESRGAVGSRDGKYVMVATVTDPSNLGDSIVVVITAEDINEDPVLSGRPELTIDEIDGGSEDAADPLFVGNEVDADPIVNVYNVVDEDRRAAIDQWSLEGEDAGQFQLIGNVGRTLVFRNQPDYENPADANGDNVYKVTVVTLDGDGGRGEFDVCIAVMNINENGKITLLDEDGNELVQPRAHGPITAELTDPDGGVIGVTWVWARSQENPPFTADDGVTDPMSATYMPTNLDTSFFLKVMATYMDEKNDAAADDTGFRVAVATTLYAVLEVEDKKRAPAFMKDGDDVESVEVTVAENSPSGTYVGEAILVAVDPDRGTTLNYTLEGEDADLFELVRPPDDDNPDTMEVATRQIRVKAPVMVAVDFENTYPTVDLNHEDERKNSYTVELKASDGALDDTIMVTITVTDRNEAPSVPMAASGATVTPTNNAPEFPAAEDGARSVAENAAAGDNIGAPVMATDADAGDTLTYTLGGTDMASFDIDGATGQLKTKAVLDFETKDSYTVEVVADDGNGGTNTMTVTITVTDVPEGSELSPYDTDNSGKIEGPEVIQAVRDYFADDITGPEVIEVVKLYFAGRSN